jgi:hypothetical protein
VISQATLESYEMLASRLDDAAASLATGQKVPIDLAGALRATELEFEACEPRVQRLEGALRHSAHGNKVVVHDVPRDGNLLPRQRFTIAHEVGHQLLERWGAPLPTNKREYWAREQLCNRFAAALLVPETAVRYALEPSPQTSSELYGRLRLIVARALVSREVASKRIETGIRGFSAWEIDDPPRAGVLGRVRWTAGSAEPLGLNRAAHVPLHHSCAELIQKARLVAIGQCTEATAQRKCWTVERRRSSVWAVGLDASPVWSQTQLKMRAREPIL